MQFYKLRIFTFIFTATLPTTRTGYLQFLRVMSMFTLFVLPAAVLNQFDAYTENAVGLGFHEAVGKSQNRVDPEDPLADRNAAAGYIAGGPYQAA